MRTYFTIIANAPRPLTETLAVWLEDYSERYSREWIETQQQICIQGGPIFKLSHQPLPWIEVYLSRWSRNRWDGNRGGNEWIFFQSLVRCHLAKKHLQRLPVRQCQVQRRLDEFLAFTPPRRLVFIHTRISNRSLCYSFHHWECHPGVIDCYSNIREHNQKYLGKHICHFCYHCPSSHQPTAAHNLV